MWWAWADNFESGELHGQDGRGNDVVWARAVPSAALLQPEACVFRYCVFAHFWDKAHYGGHVFVDVCDTTEDAMALVTPFVIAGLRRVAGDIVRGER